MQHSYEALQTYIEPMQILQYTLRSETKCALYYCCQTNLPNQFAQQISIVLCGQKLLNEAIQVDCKIIPTQ